jgi:prepilin-type processing-associated H-X9-DG protein
MDELFIGYLLDALDEPAEREVEAYLTQHPEARGRLALLEQALAPLSADRDAPAPPPLLVERTLARIAEEMCTPGKSDLPHAPPVSPVTISGGRSWWRRADLAVAASVVLTVVGIGLTILGSMRAPSSEALAAECKNNLREFFFGLQTYHNQHGRFPDVSRESPRDVAGMVVPILADAGALPEGASIRCPGLGAPLMNHVTLTSLRAMTDEDFSKYAPSLSMCYAYSLGYRDGEHYHAPGDSAAGSWSQLPLMADRPPAEGIVQNSINHGGKGQNVLYADGHVRFLPRRTIGAADDIFVNGAGQVAAGIDASDVVLGYSSARP